MQISDKVAIYHPERISIGSHAIVGAGSVLLPGASLAEGVAVGALSLITKDCEVFGVYVGNRRVGKRKRSLLELESKLRQQDYS